MASHRQSQLRSLLIEKFSAMHGNDYLLKRVGNVVPGVVVRPNQLRTLAPKSSYGEIFLISSLELVHKVLTPKIKKKWGGGGG